MDNNAQKQNQPEDRKKISPLDLGKKFTQLQIERVKREDDEEQWISGEELYTEGSSDEDDPIMRAKRRAAGKAGHRKPRSEKTPVDTSKESSPKPSPLLNSPNFCASNVDRGIGAGGVVTRDQCPQSVVNAEIKDEAKLDSKDDDDDAMVEPEPPISWRPKRGSIKLPSLDPEGTLAAVAQHQS